MDKTGRSKWMRTLWIGATLAAAIYLRADGLGLPQCWYDEAISLLRSTGHTESEVVAFASERGPIAIEEFSRFTNPDPSRGVNDTIRSLIVEDPQHMPGYYAVAYYWARWFGTGSAIMRIPPVLFSLLCLPAVFWLCSELFVKTGTFASNDICWLAMTVLAVSPYHIGFAREHREYSMWALGILLASAALLRAIRLDRLWSWALFSACLIFALQAHMLTWLVWGGFALFLLIRERGRITVRVRNFLLASAIAGVTFIPWGLVLLRHRNTAQQDLVWVGNSPRETFQFNASLYPHIRLADYAFLGLEARAEEPDGPKPVPPLAFTVLVLLASIPYFLGSRGKSLVFVGILLLTTSLPFFLPDLFTGSALGWVARYTAPSAIAWNLAFTFVLACAMFDTGRWKWFSRAAAAGALAVSAYSGYLVHADTYPFQKIPNDRGIVAAYLDLTGSDTTLVSDEYVGSLLSLSRQVRPDLRILARPRCLSCLRIGTDPVEIPGPALTRNVLYYRSWSNVGTAPRLYLQSALARDTLHDPRYHTAAVRGAGLFLYEITPR